MGFLGKTININKKSTNGVSAIIALPRPVYIYRDGGYTLHDQ